MCRRTSGTMRAAPRTVGLPPSPSLTPSHKRTRSVGQPRLLVLQEAADGGVYFEPDRLVIGFARFACAAGLCQQMRPRRPIGLVLRQRFYVNGVERGEARLCTLRFG